MGDGTGGHCRPRQQRLVRGSVGPHPAVGPKQQQRMAARMLTLSSTPTLAPNGLRTGWSEKSAWRGRHAARATQGTKGMGPRAMQASESAWAVRALRRQRVVRRLTTRWRRTGKQVWARARMLGERPYHGRWLGGRGAHGGTRGGKRTIAVEVG